MLKLSVSMIHRGVEAKLLNNVAVLSLVSCVAAVHSIRAAMHSLKKTGTDHSLRAWGEFS